MRNVKLILLVSLLSLLLFTIIGCDNEEPQVRGIRELGRFEEEPTIEVVKDDGTKSEIKFEEYINGVVAGEMKADWPQEAYAAQAVLARSFALRYMEDNNTRMISGEYRFAQEYKPEKITDRIIEGVALTRGEAAVHDNRFINGWFHASAGGHTTTAQVGLAYDRREPAYTKTVQSPDQEAPEDVQNWTAEFSIDEIANTLQEMGEEFTDVQDINIVDRDVTGRIINLEFIDEGKDIVVQAALFRRELDTERLKSTKIDDIEKTNGSFIFNGSGYGHGVGMSQWGAYSMALEGKTPEDIVDHYFKNIEIVKVYD